MPSRRGREASKARIAPFMHEQGHKFRVQSRLNARHHPRRDTLEAARLMNVLHNFPEQSLRVIPLAEELAVEGFQPPRTSRVGQERQAPYCNVNPAALGKHADERSISMQKNVRHQDSPQHGHQRQ